MAISEKFDAKVLRLLVFIDKKTRGKEEPVHLINVIGSVEFREIRLSEEDTKAAWQYLRDKNLIKTFKSHPYSALINANGIQAIKQAILQKKDELLEVIYNKAGGQVSKPVLVGDIRGHFDHWDKGFFLDTAQALEDDELIRLDGRTLLTANFILTTEGRSRVGKLMHPTHSKISTFNIGSISGQQVQVGSHNYQTVNITIQQLVEEIAKSSDPEAKSLLRKLLENSTVGGLIGAGVSALLGLL